MARQNRSLIRRRQRLAASLPDVRRILRGSLVKRYRKCGKAHCHCVRGAGHGPSYYLSVTLSSGQTRSFYIPADDRRIVERYLHNYRKLRQILEQMAEVNQKLLQQRALDPGDAD